MKRKLREPRFTDSWEEMQNHLKDGPVTIVRPSNKTNPKTLKDKP